MELSWPIRLRIIAVCAAGVLILAFAAFGFVRPADIAGAVTFTTGDINPFEAIVYLVFACLAALLAYLIAWPYGRILAPLAVPAGLAALSFRTGDMKSLMLINHTLAQKQQLYSLLQFEALYWLLLVTAGYITTLAADRFFRAKPWIHPEILKRDKNNNKNLLNIVIAVVATIVITQFAIAVFAQDVRLFDSEIGSVIGQPGPAQIAFAVIVSFALAAFLLKALIKVNYLLPAVTSVVLVFFVSFFFARAQILAHMHESWPVSFYSRSICAILPVQLISLAAIGSLAGYYLAISYQIWKENNSQ